jgi:thioredoxin 1
MLRLSSMAGCMMWLEREESERLRYHLNISRLGALNSCYGGAPKREPEGKEDMAENISSVTDNSFQSEVIEASNAQPVMVDFWADWCRPCHMLAPTVAEIAQTYAGKLKVVKLNVDENVNSAGRYNIRGIPTLLIFKGGQVADQIVGAVPKEQISKIVDRHLN